MRCSFPSRRGILSSLLMLAWVATSAFAGSALLDENFEGSFPPPDWSVVDNSDASLDCSWKRSDEYTLTGLLNDSPGAAVDARHCTPSDTPEGAVDTELHTPVLDLSNSENTLLSFDLAYRHAFMISEATLDVSTDAGGSWTNLAIYNSSPPITQFTPNQVIIDLSDYDGEPSVMLRWRYTSGHGWWMFIDNVIVGPAGPGIIDLDPPSNDFGEVHTGIQQTVELTVSNQANPGHAAFGLSTIELTGDPDFWILGGTCQAGTTTLSPAESCLIRVVFRPDSIGQFSGQLQIDTDDGQSAIFAVTGEGIPSSAIEVSPGALSAIVGIDDSASQAFSIANTGAADLEWFIPQTHGQTGPAGIGPRSGELLRQGLLLSHNAGSNSLVALDPRTGDLIDADFVDTGFLGFSSRPVALVHPDGERILLNQQTNPSVVHAFDPDGEFLGIFAPLGGPDTSIMENIRGMAFHPETGNLLVSSASFSHPHAVVEFDLDGNYLGKFIDLDQLDLFSPWGMLFRSQDLLIAIGNDVHAFTHEGVHIGQFNGTPLNFVTQISEAANGNILATASQGGVWEFDADGNYIANYDAYSSTSGVHELAGGTLLVSANTGIHEIDRDNNPVRDVIGGSSNMFSLVQAVDCSIPDWLEVQPLSGTVNVGGAPDEVIVTFLAAGLDPGTYEDVLCIESNDPSQSRVQLPVTLTVGQPDGYGSVEGTVESLGHCGTQSAPLAGASIEAMGAGGEIRHRLTDEDGRYQFFMPEKANPIELTVSAPGHHATVLAGVEVTADGITVEDFGLVLDEACIDVPQSAYHFSLDLGEQATEVLTIGNQNGAGSLNWLINQGPGLAAAENPRAHFPAEVRRIQHRDRAGVSLDAPLSNQIEPAEAAADRNASFGVLAYSTTGTSTPPGYVKLDALAPESLTIINASQPTRFYAGTFIRNDFKRHYVLAGAGGTSALNTFGYIDPDTGELTELGTISGAPSVSGWNSLSWDHTSGTLYALGNLDELFTIDPDSLEATRIGRLEGDGLNPGGVVAVALAVSPEGLMYAIDLVDNALLAVDKTTAEAAVIGDFGFDINFAQDMDFDHRTGTLYWAAFLNTNASRIYSIDTASAELTLMGNVQGAAELLSFSIASAGGGCSTPADIPWLSVSENSGTVAPGGSHDLSLNIDTSALAHGDYEAFICVESNDPFDPQVWVPVSVSVHDPDVGFLEGVVSSDGYCSDEPYELAGAELVITGNGGSYQAVTDSEGRFELPVKAGHAPLEIHVTSPGHLAATVTGVSIEPGATTEQQVSLTLDAPCFRMEPNQLDVHVSPGASATRPLTIDNLDGHAALNWTTDTAGRLGDDSILMSQNLSTLISPDHRPGCPVGANHAFRRFSFADHPGVGNRITSVEFGLNEAGASAVVTVNLFAIPASVEENTIPVEQLELLQSVVVPISNADNETIISVPFDTVVADISASDLVVEVVSGSPYVIGANGAGETRPGFVAAPGCNIHEPTRLDQIDGLEDVQILLMVNAISGGACALPEAISWLDLSPAAGTTGAGETSTMTVAFDANGLSDGLHEAVVCVNSDDAHRPRIEVPVSMLVSDQAPAELQLNPVHLDFGPVQSGQSEVREFTITNTADAGALDLMLTEIALSGDSEFTHAAGSCVTGQSIAPQASCTVEIGFAPNASGQFSGLVTVEAGTHSGQVTLAGEEGQPVDTIFSDRFDAESR